MTAAIATEDVPPKRALKEVFNSMFADCKIDEAQDATTDDFKKKQMDDWAGMVHTILAGDESSVGSDEISKAFENWECNRKYEDEQTEFAHIEAFITREIKLGIGRRKKARDLQAGEELT